ncbi:hypothetical protein [Halobacillus salinus]|nr:hypothetical protein [Halobacillus salinus]
MNWMTSTITSSMYQYVRDKITGGESLIVPVTKIHFDFIKEIDGGAPLEG